MFSLALSTITNEVSLRRLTLFIKVWINLKSYYNFMFFRTVCYSFKGFKCVRQKLEVPKKIPGYLSDPNNTWNFAKPRKIAQMFANTENRIWPNFRPKKIGQANFDMWKYLCRGCGRELTGKMILTRRASPMLLPKFLGEWLWDWTRGFIGNSAINGRLYLVINRMEGRRLLKTNFQWERFYQWCYQWRMFPSRFGFSQSNIENI